jgi:hypothetical protein
MKFLKCLNLVLSSAMVVISAVELARVIREHNENKKRMQSESFEARRRFKELIVKDKRFMRWLEENNPEMIKKLGSI